MTRTRSVLQSLGERRFLVLCIVGIFAICSTTMSKNPVLKPLANDLGTPEHLLGFVAAASTIPGILFSLPAGTLSDIFGRRRVLLGSSLIFASAPFFYLLISSWSQLILLRFYHGFATAMFVPVANASIAERFPTRCGERISSFSSAMTLGRVTAPFLGGYILSVTNYGYGTLYLAVGIAGIIALITALLFLSNPESSSAEPELPATDACTEGNGWKSAMRILGFVTTSVVEAAQYYAFGAVEFFLVGYLTEIVRLDLFLVGIVLGGQLAIIPLVKPFLGRLSDRIGRKPPIVMGSLVGGLSLAAIPFTTQFPILLSLSVVYGVGFSLVTSSTPALASELVGTDQIGAAMGLLCTVMDVGQTLGPIITGLILSMTLSYHSVFASLTLIIIAACLAFIATMGRIQPHRV